MVEVKKWETLNNKVIKGYTLKVKENSLIICNDKLCIKYDLSKSKFELWNMLFCLGINVMVKDDMNSLLDD